MIINVLTFWWHVWLRYTKYFLTAMKSVFGKAWAYLKREWFLLVVIAAIAVIFLLFELMQ